MKVYQDITLIPADDIGLYFLWGKVYQQLHLALVEQQIEKNVTDIGVGFPEYRKKPKALGCKIRLFAANEARLNELNIVKWLERIMDYVHITSIKAVPDVTQGYEKFSRLQAKANIERLARRAAKRKAISYEEALKERLHIKVDLPNFPYLQVKSLSKGEGFSLFVKSEVAKENIKGLFSTYGLSKGGVLPKF